MKIVSASEDGIQAALQVLRDGGVVAHATETCYGLACDITNHDAVAKLFAIKKRPETQPVSALFASADQAQQFLEWNEEASHLASEHLPGPLTIILKAKPGCALYATPGGSESVGVRISSHPTAQELVQRYGSPLSTTSANVHGQPNPYSANDIQTQYQGESLQPDLLIDGGEIPPAEASTVIDVSSGVLNVLRKGDIAI